MSKTLDTLVEDIYYILDSDTDHEPSEENIQAAGEQLKELLRTRLRKRDRDAAVLRFSALGKPDRRLWYDAHMPDKAEKLLPKHYLKWLYGDIIELLVLFLAKEAGHTVEREQEQVDCDGVKGHIDAVIDGVVVDVKSASSFGFKKFADGSIVDGDDPFGYIKQISGYANVLTPQQGAAFIAADKVHGDLAVTMVGAGDVGDNPPGPRIGRVREVLASDVPPARCYDKVADGKSGNYKLGTECSYCPFKFECWKDSNGGEGLKVYSYYQGPRFFTDIKRDPRVKEGDRF